MNDQRYTLDTNIIILYLKNDAECVRFVDEAATLQKEIRISTITLAELFSVDGLTDEEEARIRSAMADVTIIPVDEQVAHTAGKLRRKYGLRLGDSIIAATAQAGESTLVTRDKHFENIPGVIVQFI